jgi:hypothetical protein
MDVAGASLDPHQTVLDDGDRAALMLGDVGWANYHVIHALVVPLTAGVQ